MVLFRSIRKKFHKNFFCGQGVLKTFSLKNRQFWLEVPNFWQGNIYNFIEKTHKNVFDSGHRFLKNIVLFLVRNY